MKAPFHIEFQTVNDADTTPYAIRDGYFLIDFDSSDVEQVGKLATYLRDKMDDAMKSLETDFGPHDIQSTSGTLVSWTSCDVDPDNFKKLLRKWRREFHNNGFKTEDVYVVNRDEFNNVLAGQTPDERNIIDDLANGEMPAPRQTAFAFKV